jgi:hypothetical protein
VLRDAATYLGERLFGGRRGQRRWDLESGGGDHPEGAAPGGAGLSFAPLAVLGLSILIGGRAACEPLCPTMPLLCCCTSDVDACPEV